MIALFFFEGSTFGSSLATQKPSFEIQANLCKVLFHFHSKLRLGPKSGFRKIDFSTTKRPLNIFLSIGNDSLADSTPIKRVISKTRFSRFLDHKTISKHFSEYQKRFFGRSDPYKTCYLENQIFVIFGHSDLVWSI